MRLHDTLFCIGFTYVIHLYWIHYRQIVDGRAIRFENISDSSQYSSECLKGVLENRLDPFSNLFLFNIMLCTTINNYNISINLILVVEPVNLRFGLAALNFS